MAFRKKQKAAAKEPVKGVSNNTSANDRVINSLPRRIIRKVGPKRAIAVVLVVGLAAAGASFWLYNNTGPNKTVIKVGDVEIKQSDVDARQDKLAGFYKFFGDSVDEKELEGRALDSLILYHGLTQEAARLDKSVTEAELTAKFEANAKLHKVDVADFERIMQETYGFSHDDLVVNYSIEILKEKLKDDLLSSKEVLYVLVRYDLTEENEEVEDREIKQVFKDKFAPLFERKASAEEIVNSTDYHEDGQRYGTHKGKYPSTGSVYVDLNREAKPNQFQDNSEWDTINGLNEIGDYTQEPVKSQAGYYYMYRLEKKSRGQFNTWDNFLQNVKDNAKYYGVDSLVMSFKRPFAALFGSKASASDLGFCSVGEQQASRSIMSRIFSRFGFQKAHAQACAAPNHLTGWTGYVTTTGGVTPDSVRVDVSLRPGYPTVFCGGLSSGTHYTDGAGYYNTGLNYSCFTSWQATFSKANCTSASRDLYQAVGDNGHMHSGDQNITLTCSLPPTYPYTIQGYRTYGSGSGTAFPSGTGTTTICGTGYTNNYFQVTGIPGDCYISSSSPIIHGGRTYDLIGNSMCYDTTSCHGGGPNNPAGYEFLRHVDLSGPTAGRYVDIYWHYRLRDAAPTLSITSSCATKRYTITASDADGSPVPVEYQIRTNGGSWSGWTSVSVSGSYNYDMSSRSQYDVYEMQVRTRGVVAAGNPTPAYTTAGPRVYGVSSTRACLDRGFSVDAIPRKPVLTPDPEDPSSATFGSSARSTITPTPAGNPTAVIGVSMDRDYFVRHVSGTVTSISPGPSSPDPRSVNVPRSSDLPDITDSRSLASLTLNSGDAICVRVTLSPASGTVDTAGNIITGSGSNTDESCEFVVSKPYFRVYNSDVSSGFVNCTGWSSGLTSGQILGWNHGNGAGSGTQLAAYAVGTINEFSTATGRTSTAPLPPKGLTFANNTGATYGAGFGSGFCAYDYFGNKSSSASVSTGNVTIPGRTLSPGQKIAVYVDGNAYITGNIQYPATWASISDIPSYVLIVRGNIYINPSVTRLDGLYVAQPNGASGGELLTCALGFSSPTVAQLATNCATSLTFNGSIVAKWPRLLRTNGSLRNSSNTEARSSATAAEKFIFGPESWLSNAVEYPDSPIEYDSATSSAPIL